MKSRTAPLDQPAAGEASQRMASATSSARGDPVEGALGADRVAARGRPGRPPAMSVAMKPGAIDVTVMSCGASETAIDCPRACSPAFAGPVRGHVRLTAVGAARPDIDDRAPPYALGGLFVEHLPGHAPGQVRRPLQIHRQRTTPGRHPFVVRRLRRADARSGGTRRPARRRTGRRCSPVRRCGRALQPIPQPGQGLRPDHRDPRRPPHDPRRAVPRELPRPGRPHRGSAARPGRRPARTPSRSPLRHPWTRL